jgi:hypothetical protein
VGHKYAAPALDNAVVKKEQEQLLSTKTPLPARQGRSVAVSTQGRSKVQKVASSSDAVTAGHLSEYLVYIEL